MAHSTQIILNFKKEMLKIKILFTIVFFLQSCGSSNNSQPTEESVYFPPEMTKQENEMILPELEESSPAPKDKILLPRDFNFFNSSGELIARYQISCHHTRRSLNINTDLRHPLPVYSMVWKNTRTQDLKIQRVESIKPHSFNLNKLHHLYQYNNHKRASLENFTIGNSFYIRWDLQEHFSEFKVISGVVEDRNCQFQLINTKDNAKEIFAIPEENHYLKQESSQTHFFYTPFKEPNIKTRSIHIITKNFQASYTLPGQMSLIIRFRQPIKELRLDRILTTEHDPQAFLIEKINRNHIIIKNVQNIPRKILIRLTLPSGSGQEWYHLCHQPNVLNSRFLREIKRRCEEMATTTNRITIEPRWR